MDTAALLKKVRRIEIRSRGLSKHLFSGEYHSVFKGRGMSFSEVRDYTYGDDVRSIDWNVTARTGTPHVKVFEEERELTLMLLIDVSRSEHFGTKGGIKKDLMTEIAAVLSFSAIQNNDKVGVILFSDQVEKYIPPKKGRQHILLIIRELLQFEPKSKGTDISVALRYFNNVLKKRTICFLMSDYLDKGYEDALRIASRRHDLVGLRLSDPFEEGEVPKGLYRVGDGESGRVKMVDLSSSAQREAIEKYFADYRENYRKACLKSGVDMLTIRTDEPYVKSLLKFFKQRRS
jgi:uncharacterized protein (DUF58 family)